eukprot:UN24118
MLNFFFPPQKNCHRKFFLRRKKTQRQRDTATFIFQHNARKI